MKHYELLRTTVIPHSLNTVFDFFSRPENLQLLTPDFLQFTIKTELPIKMKEGAIIDYRLKFMFIPFNWQTHISVWNPPFHFADVQAKGPYEKWEHHHFFESIPEGTRMIDRVWFKPPGWILSPLIHHLIVKPQVEKIFDYRSQALKEIFS